MNNTIDYLIIGEFIKKKLSVIVSCYNGEDSIPLFYKEINKVSKKMKDLNFGFIYIDEGSFDKTLDVIKNLVKNDKRVHFIFFSRNFGKEANYVCWIKIFKRFV